MPCTAPAQVPAVQPCWYIGRGLQPRPPAPHINFFPPRLPCRLRAVQHRHRPAGPLPPPPQALPLQLVLALVPALVVGQAGLAVGLALAEALGQAPGLAVALAALAQAAPVAPEAPLWVVSVLCPRRCCAQPAGHALVGDPIGSLLCFALPANC